MIEYIKVPKFGGVVLKPSDYSEMRELESKVFTNSYDAVKSVEKFDYRNICVTDGSITEFCPQYLLRLDDIEGDDLDFMKTEKIDKTYEIAINENYASVFEMDTDDNEIFEIARIYVSLDQVYQLYGAIDNYNDL